MKDLEITILRSDVMRRVALDSAYVAAKNARADELCDSVPVVDADDELLGNYWSQACARARTALAEYLSLTPRPCAPVEATLPSSEDLNIHLRLPDNYNMATAITLQQLLASFLTYDILAEWLGIALPEAENRYRTAAAAHLALLGTALERRRRPLSPIRRP